MITRTHKICPRCEIDKQAEEFYSIQTKYDGLSVYCRPCHLIVVRMQKYGISGDALQAMLELQENRCAICEVEFVEGDKTTTYHVDHIFNTKTIRGLLCNTCNRFIGLAQHDIGILEAAIRYIQERGS